jgi:hypothetical protein
MAGADQEPAMSVIERMAAKHHECSGHLVSWKLLSRADQERLTAAMEAAVGVIPDELSRRSGGSPSTVAAGETRDALIELHEEAEASDG